MIEKPSPGYWTTPLIGVLENGGTNAATFEPMASVNFWVSQVPSTIIAALPEVNWLRFVVSVRTSLLVQPLLFRPAHLVNCAFTAGPVHGIAPL